MSQTPAYDFENGDRFAVVSFNPPLSDCRWGDIEEIGTELKDRLSDMDCPRFLLDLTKLEFMGSSIVALIVKLWKTTQEKGGDMVVVNKSSMIGEVLEIAGLSRVWKIVDSREDAEEMLGGKGFSPVSPMTRFFLAILGWVTAAGALCFVLAPRKELIQIEPQVAQGLAFTCGGIAIIAGLVSAIRDRGAWRLLGILLVLVAGGLIGAAVFG